MNYAEKLERMSRHLEAHPNDYQTVIARLKTASKAIDRQRRKNAVSRLKNLANIKRQLKEEDDARRMQ